MDFDNSEEEINFEKENDKIVVNIKVIACGIPSKNGRIVSQKMISEMFENISDENFPIPIINMEEIK